MPESDLVRSGGSSYQIEHGAIVRTRQSRIEPLEKLARGTKRRESVVLNGREHCRAYDDLAARIPLAFGVTDTRG